MNRHLAFCGLLALWVSGCCCGIGGTTTSGGSAAPVPAPGVVGPAVPAAPMVAAYDPAFIGAHVMRARMEAGCDAVPMGNGAIFCPALRGWDAGTAAPLPPGPVALVGISTWIPTTGSFAASDAQLRRLSFLGVRSDATGRYGALISPSGDNPMETMAVAQTQVAVATAVQTGATTPIGVSAGLHAFATGQAQQARYPIATTGNGWQLQGGSFADVRRVGNVWVAIEVPRNAPAGLYFSVFLDAPITPQ